MLTPDEFFSDAADAYIRQLDGFDGIVKIHVQDGEGQVWYVDVNQKAVSREIAAKPHVIIRAYWRDFMALVEGKMSVADGLVTGRLHLVGEAGRLAELGDALARVLATRVHA